MDYVDLFAGAGGVSSGIHRAGFRCVLAVDSAADANLVYSANFPETQVSSADLAGPLPETTGPVDVVVGGPPCQDYSTARLKGDDQGRAKLTVAYARHAVALEPTWIVLENVPMARKSAELAEALEIMEAAGYVWHWEIVRARVVAGMAQNRRRLVVLACRDDSSREASRRRLETAWAHLRTPCPTRPQTMRECFAAAGLECPTDHVYIPACNQKARRSIYPVDGPAPTIRTLLRPLRARYTFLPQDSTQSRDQVFSLTLAHMAALQGFPRDFQFPLPQTRAARCIGNAVPPPVAERIARALLHADSSHASSAGGAASASGASSAG